MKFLPKFHNILANGSFGREVSLRFSLKTRQSRFSQKKGTSKPLKRTGTRRVPAGIDYITCSPKQQFEKIRTLIPEVDELRFPIAKGDVLPDISILPKTNRYLLSPIFDNLKVIRENVDYCVDLIKQNPQWTLSLQMHKLIGIK